MALSEVHIVYGYEEYELPFDPLECFADKTAAELFAQACRDHDLLRPRYPEEDCSEEEYKRWDRKNTRWMAKAPYGKDRSPFAGYSVHTMQVKP